MDVRAMIRPYTLLPGGILHGNATDTAAGGTGFFVQPDPQGIALQPGHAAGVDAALQRLKPVAGLWAFRNEAVP